jgi:hypothetical protein
MSCHPTSSIFILSSNLSIYTWVSQVVSFPHVSLPKPCIHFSFRHTCYMPHPPHSSRFYHPNNIWWWVQVIKFLVTQSSPLPCHLVSLKCTLNETNCLHWIIFIRGRVISSFETTTIKINFNLENKLFYILMEGTARYVLQCKLDS